MEKRNSQLRGYMESSLNDLFLTIMIFIVQIVMAVVGLSGGGPDWRGDLLFCFIALFTGTYALYLLTRTATAVAD